MTQKTVKKETAPKKTTPVVKADEVKKPAVPVKAPAEKPAVKKPSVKKTPVKKTAVKKPAAKTLDTQTAETKTCEKKCGECRSVENLIVGADGVKSLTAPIVNSVIGPILLNEHQKPILDFLQGEFNASLARLKEESVLDFEELVAPILVASKTGILQSTNCGEIVNLPIRRFVGVVLFDNDIWRVSFLVDDMNGRGHEIDPGLVTKDYAKIAVGSFTLATFNHDTGESLLESFRETFENVEERRHIMAAISLSI